MKLETSELCKGTPPEFGQFIDYARGLPFKSEPNYKFCIQLFRKVAMEHNYSPRDLIFDWDMQGGSK